MADEQKQAANESNSDRSIEFTGVPATKIFTQEAIDLISSVFGEKIIYVLTLTKLEEKHHQYRVIIGMAPTSQEGFGLAPTSEQKDKVVELVRGLGGAIKEVKE